MMTKGVDDKNIGSDKDLMSPSNKPLIELMLTQDLCCHMKSPGHEELRLRFDYSIVAAILFILAGQMLVSVGISHSVCQLQYF